MPEQKIDKYDLDKLFAKLSTIDENTRQPIALMIGRPGGQVASVWQYMPVTKELVKDWGRVNNLLHYRFFLRNKDWYAEQKLWPEYNTRALVDYRELLGDIAKCLEEASSGDLLAPPPFLKFIEDLDKDVEE